ncbi:MAG: component of the polarisome, partial [Watsoniomyces obsoletus]
MVEDEDELHGVDSRYDRSSDAFGLESALTSPHSDRDTSATSQSVGSGGTYSKNGPLQNAELQDEVNQLREQLKVKDNALSRHNSSQQHELERKLADAEQHSKSLQDQLEEIHSEHATVERDLRAELEIAKQAAAAGRPGEELVRENESMQKRLQAQQDIIDDVRKQGHLYLEEMRAMAESGAGNFERED